MFTKCQKTERNWKPADVYWFENRPLGVNKLGNIMMSTISGEASLSRRYTVKLFPKSDRYNPVV